MQRIHLSTWPTPMEPAPRLAVAIGLRPDDLWIKRDDLTGLGAGGNKVRKLEWTVGAALAEGADVLVTTGAPQSNHARLTAAAAARAGLRSVLVFPGPPPTESRGNLLLDTLLGTEIRWADTAELGDCDMATALATIARQTAEDLRVNGHRPAVIPFGGSSGVGAQGYRVAADEIKTQTSDVDHVVCAVGSGGTMAGLVAGLGPERVRGIDTGAISDPHARVAQILTEMDSPADPASLDIDQDQIGRGYPTLTSPAAQALTLAARIEGLILDPTYTGRALAGLIAQVARGAVQPGDRTVFLASGGLPGLFGHPESHTLS
ncbi:pyridoxal-phosphate dependent enzyme [Nocardia callitridis]|uniref:Pyridoxal-phosphate dependent enzyme n=1 Tax=Nocardia callitridis TaxID=648753 RepID=A0ABP9K446_9NOCA